MTQNTINDLRGITGSATDNFYNVLGYYAPGDHGGGDFYWDASSADTDNGGTIIKPTAVSGNGRWKRLYSGAVDVKWFGAKGDGSTNDSSAIENALNFSAKIYFSAGTYKANFQTPVTPFSIDLRTATLIPNSTSLPVITCRNATWTSSEIIGGFIDGIDKTGTGIELGLFDNGRVRVVGTDIQRCHIALSKAEGAIGCTFESVNLKFNTIGFLALSYENPPAKEHSGCDVWTGGNIAENNYGILYFNIVSGWGQVVLNGTILQNNEVNGIFYSTHSGVYGGFMFNSLWNEGAYLRHLETDLVLPQMANKPYFDNTGKWAGPYNSVVVYGTASFDGLGIEGNLIHIDTATDVDNAFIGDKTYTFPTATNLQTVLRTAEFSANAIDLPLYRVNRVTNAALTAHRGFFALHPQDSRKMWMIPGLTGVQDVPTSFVGAVPDSTSFDAVYANSGARFTTSFDNDAYKLIDDIADSAGILYHSVTITLLEPAAANDRLYFFLMEDGVHTYGTTPRGVITLKDLTVNIPVTLAICVAAEAGKTAGIWWQGFVTNNAVHVQDMFQFTTDNPDFAIQVYNNRGCIS